MQVTWAVPAGSLKLSYFSSSYDPSTCFTKNRLAPAPSSSSSSSCARPPSRSCFHGRKLLFRAVAASAQKSALEEGNAGAMVVKVKFVLQEKCEFGQQFHVVGDNAQLGCWDPAAAIPLHWSDGHVWTTMLDLSVGKRVEFKLILTGKEDDVEWQPGPNRVFETPVTPSFLVVSGSWCGEDVLVVQVTENSEVLHNTSSSNTVDEFENTASEALPVRSGRGFSLQDSECSNDEGFQEDAESEWVPISSEINQEEEVEGKEEESEEEKDQEEKGEEEEVEEKEEESEEERDQEEKGGYVVTTMTSRAAEETIESEMVLEEEVIEEPNLVSSSSSLSSVIEKDLTWGQKALTSIWALVQKCKQ